MNNDMNQTATAKKQDEQAFTTNENFAELFEKHFENVEEGNVKSGTIVSIQNDFALVDIGYKTEGRIPLREFVKDGKPYTPTVGDKIDVYVERVENKEGEAVLSHEKAMRESYWKDFENAHGEGSTVEGVIFGRVKGGFTVDLGGTIAFLPGSQVDVRPVKDITPLVGIKQPFQILKMDRKRGNIVVSRRAILEESRSAERDKVLSKISQGDVVEGTVKNITDYGAFIDLGVVDGLLHVTDISWKRIGHPSEALKLGEKIKVKVIKFDESNGRISLGIKQLEDSPWQNIEDRYPLQSKAKGRITNITDYGAFVELGDGVEGLVHVSEMSWVKKNVHPNKIVNVGDSVEVMVLDIDREKHRISLGMKQCQENPWDDFSKKYPEGSTLKGKIKNIAEFGLFVEVEGAGIDGLVHLSDVAWENSDNKIKEFNKGDDIEVMVLGVDTDNERISLGIKQLQGDPFESVAGKFNKGDVATFEVTGVKEDGIEVRVTDKVTSFIKRADLSKERVEQRPDRFAVGDRVDAKVTGMDKKTRKISLSIKALEAEEQKKAIKDYGSTDSGASLGDILGVALQKGTAKEPKKAAKKKKDAE